MKAGKLVLQSILPFFLALSCSQTWALQANGTAAYNEFGNQIYLGTLFLDMPSNSATDIIASTQRKRMELRFSSEMSKRRWTQTWTQSIAINSSRDAMVSAADDLSEALSAFQDNLHPGDTVIFDYNPLSGTSVFMNGTLLVEKKSPSLFNLLLSSWIGGVPPTSQFKNAILGATDSSADYAAFQSITPSQVRIDAIAGWNTKVKEEEARALAEARAEEEAMRKAEEEARIKAEQEALAEQERQALIEEERRKAQEAARVQAEAARREAETEREKAEQQSAVADGAPGQEEEDLTVDAILAQQAYTSQIITQIYKYVRYPSAAVSRNHEGSVRANVVIDRAGALKQVTLADESEFRSLNKAVIDAITDASPFPALPASIGGEQLELTVPVSFKLN